MALYDRFTADEKIMMSATDVVGHIERKAEEIRAQAKVEGWTFFGVPSTIGAEMYPNVYEYELAMAVSEYSDAHKEVYGRRPRLNNWRTGNMQYTLTEIEEMIDFLYARNKNLINM